MVSSRSKLILRANRALGVVTNIIRVTSMEVLPVGITFKAKTSIRFLVDSNLNIIYLLIKEKIMPVEIDEISRGLKDLGWSENAEAAKIFGENIENYPAWVLCV